MHSADYKKEFSNHTEILRSNYLVVTLFVGSLKVRNTDDVGSGRCLASGLDTHTSASLFIASRVNAWM